MEKRSRKGKNILFFLIGVSFWSSCLLTACSRQEEEKSVSQKERQVEIGVLLYNQSDVFLQGLMEALGEALAERQEEGLTVSLLIRDGKESQKTENSQARDLLEAGCDILCVNLVDRTAPSAIIDMAMERNVPLIFFNREPVEADVNRWEKCYYIGSRAKEAGRLQGELAASALKEGALGLSPDRNKDGVIQYILLEGEVGHQDAIIRTEVSVETLMEKGIELEKLSYQIANWNRAQAQNKMAQMIESYGSSIELVLANNDEMALGALEAYERANVTETDIPLIFGTDGTREAMQAVTEGRLAGTVYQDKEGIAEKMADLSLALLEDTGQEEITEKLGFEDGRRLYLPYQKLGKQEARDRLSEKR